MSGSTLLNHREPEAGTPSSPAIPWNYVTKNLVGHELLRKKLREKITKLQKQLKHFPTDAVHLNIVLERHPRRNFHTARLTLRLPSNILHSAKSAPDVIAAFDLSVKALLRELQALKTDLRGEIAWKRKERRAEFRRIIKGAGFTALPQQTGEGPQDQADVVAEFLRQHYAHLVRHAQRQVKHLELSKDISTGALDPREVIDVVVRQTMNGWSQKPAHVDWLVWFYQLIGEEIARSVEHLRSNSSLSLEEVKLQPDEAQAVEGYDAENPLDVIMGKLEPFVAELRELVPDSSTMPPDKAVARKELLEIIQSQMETWPLQERNIFELHFVEGFEVKAIAVITHQRTGQVRRKIAALHQRLRSLLLEETPR
jgi:ribosome-associated translation inhibitor RaiA